MRTVTKLLWMGWGIAGLLATVQVEAALQEPSSDQLARKIDFNNEIRPILSDRCFACHGPDEKKRQAQVRLDTQEGALAPRGDRFIISPTDPEESEVYSRITHAKEEERMPPAEFGRSLSEKEIELIRLWIEQGAQWQEHWSFLRPKRPMLPEVENQAWCRNPIDAFVARRLENEGLHPSPEADKRTLIRRLSLDLTGLPPSIEEVEIFLADERPEAYEALVDRLLASPAYGERMAIPWLNAARYADSSGYQADWERFMWPWRDWVVEALNDNMPFDQFTIEQLAGDLLPNASLSQRLATGFNRNHRINDEGGIIEAEYLVEYVVDRVDTTAAVWLGLTMGCARCHDHKYDPISQEAYYRLYAYFNNIPERGRDGRIGAAKPYINVPEKERWTQYHRLAEKIERQRRAFESISAKAHAPFKVWRGTVQDTTWRTVNALWREVAHYPLDGVRVHRFVTHQKEQTPDVRAVDHTPTWVHGVVGEALQLDGEHFVDLGNAGDFGTDDSFSLGAWVHLANKGKGTLISRRSATGKRQGYDIHVDKGRIRFTVAGQGGSTSIQAKKAIDPDRWQHVFVSYDGSGRRSGLKIYLNGRHVEEKDQTGTEGVRGECRTDAPLYLGGSGSGGVLRANIDDLRIYDRVLSEGEIASLIPVNVCGEEPSLARGRSLESLEYQHYLAFYHPDAKTLTREMAKTRDAINDIAKRGSLVMVMKEMPTPRDTYLLRRGLYDKPDTSKKLRPGIPEALRNGVQGGTNRLDLARWIVSESNPLTARVTVNRYWQHYFGAGLVKTSEDFGSQGEWPSHPQLLDWLATEFMAKDWDVKYMQRLIVTSATYRQSSKVTRAHLEQDPDNRLLARGPRLRLSAQTIRDQALAASGLLVKRMGGPPVKPYQPAGLWEELAFAGDKTTLDRYRQDHGEKLYRRSLYTFWKRTVPPPSMMNFDTADREMCSLRKATTNTPIQALTLMNDPTYVEAARALAARMLQEGGGTVGNRIEYGMQLVLGRLPEPEVKRILSRGLATFMARFEEHPDAARALLQVGEYCHPVELDHQELAAYTTLASVILNLDETVTKD